MPLLAGVMQVTVSAHAGGTGCGFLQEPAGGDATACRCDVNDSECPCRWYWVWVPARTSEWGSHCSPVWCDGECRCMQEPAGGDATTCRCDMCPWVPMQVALGVGACKNQWMERPLLAVEMSQWVSMQVVLGKVACNNQRVEMRHWYPCMCQWKYQCIRAAGMLTISSALVCWPWWSVVKSCVARVPWPSVCCWNCTQVICVNWEGGIPQTSLFIGAIQWYSGKRWRVVVVRSVFYCVIWLLYSFQSTRGCMWRGEYGMRWGRTGMAQHE